MRPSASTTQTGWTMQWRISSVDCGERTVLVNANLHACEQRGQVVLAVPGPHRALDLLADHGQQPEVVVVALGGLEHEVEVLARQREREARRRELALDHRGALEVRVRRADRPAGDRLEERARVDVDVLRE